MAIAILSKESPVVDKEVTIKICNFEECANQRLKGSGYCREHTTKIANARNKRIRRLKNPKIIAKKDSKNECVDIIPYPLSNPEFFVAKVKLCSVDGCDRESRKKGAMCHRHYGRKLKYGTLDPIGFEDGKRICVVCNKEKTYDEFVSEVAKKINPTVCSLCRKKEEGKRRRKREKERNPEKYKARQNAHKRNREARISGNGGRHTAKDILFLLDMQKCKCATCKVNIKNNYNVDHVIPLALGGSNAKDNLQLLCPTCNRAKSAKHPVDFMQEIGFLI